ncbi:hypothetical protein O6H91_13G106200 [Diphasiastrum complanatum]|uniref:Uncharacterized protein n=1 Tax=Diphasiastrum complanatum TaxID=34168 RepID=A0ACC2BY92_DIPCM|nr:hypothetical protein O6H91_13G106200 [Diphasiastrum complanatum]
MRAIKLPEPPGSSSSGMPEIFDRGISCVVRRVVIIGNGAAGAEHQSIGLVRALGLGNNYSLFLPKLLQGKWEDVDKPEEERSTKIIPDADAQAIATLAREEINREGPLLVVASGRDTVPVAEAVKKLAPQFTFVVQIQHPRRRLDHFDMVITPLHDFYALSPAAQQEIPRLLRPFVTPQQPPDKHVVLTVGALHHADNAMLRAAAATWHAELAPLPKPLLIVNVGGPTRYCQYGEDLVLELISAVKQVLASCGSIRISFSRRTPHQISEMLCKELGGHAKVYIWDGRGPNPHLGHLAWGDAFVLTADSVSMLSESCSTGKPVYVIGGERCTWKIGDFHRTLRQRGLIRSFTGAEDMSESWSYPPLNDNAEAAARIRGALAERGWSLG